jgi:hypothetical protein
MRVIALCGVRGAGKDVVADAVCRWDPRFVNLKFAQPIKDALARLFDLDERHVDGELKDVEHERWGVSPRVLMQWFGTDVMQHGLASVAPRIGRTFWCDKMRASLEDARMRGRDVVISDLRFQHELDALRRWYGCVAGDALLVVRIVRPAPGRARSDDVDAHESESGVADVGPVDVTLLNDGTRDELCDRAVAALSSFSGRCAPAEP